MIFSLDKDLNYSGFDDTYLKWVFEKHNTKLKIGDPWPGFEVKSKSSVTESKKKIINLFLGKVKNDNKTLSQKIYGKALSWSYGLKVFNKNGIVDGITFHLVEKPSIREKSFTESEVLNLELVAENVQNSVVITDAKKNVEYVNPAFEKLTGYRFSEVKGKTLSILQGRETSAKDIKEMDQKLRQKEPFSIVILNYSKSGKPYWLEIFITPIFDKKGKLKKYIGIQNDITERKEFEDATIRNEAQYLAIINSLHEGVVAQNTDDQIFLANDSAAKILGLTKDQLLGKDSFDPRWKALNRDGSPLKPEDHPSMVTLRTGKPVTNFLMNVHVGNKDRKVISINSEPVKDQDKNIFGVVATFLDVTEQTIMQQELSDSEERYRLLVENAPVGIILHMDGKIKIRNSYAAKILEEKKTRNSLINKKFLDIIHPDFKDIATNRYARLKSGKISKLEELEEKIITCNGKAVDVLKSGIAISYKGNPAFLTVFSDLTKIKESEELVKANQERLRNMANSVPGALLQYRLNPDGTDQLEYISDQVVDLWEVTSEVAMKDIGKLWAPILDEDVPSMQESIMKSATNLSFWDSRWRIKTKSGKVKWLNGRGIPKRLPDGGFLWDTLILDITELKSAEHQLEETNKQLELAVDTAKMGIWTHDIKLDKLTWNEVLYDIYELKKEDFTSQRKDWENKLHEDDRERMLSVFDKLYHGESAYNVYFRIKPKPDVIRHIQASGVPVKDETGQILKLIGINVDVTDFIEKEEKLEQALNAKNTLLKELHHRIKNNLNLISNLLYLKSKTTNDKALLDYIKETKSRINTVAKTHDQLLRMEEFDQLDIKEYLEELINALIATYTTNGTEYPLKLKIEHYKLSVDKILIIGLLTNEIILNTIKHAYEAGIGGPVFITFKKMKDVIRLTIYDNGKGIPDRILKSTKSTGLELINLLVQQLKGTVKQETVKGVKYVIDFPPEG